MTVRDCPSVFSDFDFVYSCVVILKIKLIKILKSDVLKQWCALFSAVRSNVDEEMQTISKQGFSSTVETSKCKFLNTVVFCVVVLRILAVII